MSKKKKKKRMEESNHIGANRLPLKNKGYSQSGASVTRKALKGFLASSGAAYEDIDENNHILRQRSRALYMAAPVATSAIKTNRTNVIGIGLIPKSRIDRKTLGMTQEQADAWQAHTEKEFALWASKKQACDSTGVNNFYGMQQLALISWLVSGDAFVLIKREKPTRFFPYSLRLHLIEADRISTPSGDGISYPACCTVGKSKDGNLIFDGVEVDQNGKILAYHIRNTYPYEWTTNETKWIRIEAYGEKSKTPNILQVMESERPEQYRGVTYLAQVIEPLLQLRRYTESELVAAVVESFFTAFILTDTGGDENPFNEVGGNEEQISRAENEYEMGPGQINFLRNGEDVKFGNPKRPNSGFETFMKAICTQIGAALEIPEDLLLKSFNASYSASRAALLEAWKGFRMRRDWFVSDFCKPVYEIWMEEAVSRGRVYAPGFFADPLIRMAYLGSEWIGPSQGQLDPVKEITAEILAIEEGITTREQATIRQNGGQWDANVERLEVENQKLFQAKSNSVSEKTKETGMGDLSEQAIASVLKNCIKEVLTDGKD